MKKTQKKNKFFNIVAIAIVTLLAINFILLLNWATSVDLTVKEKLYQKIATLNATSFISDRNSDFVKTGDFLTDGYSHNTMALYKKLSLTQEEKLSVVLATIYRDGNYIESYSNTETISGDYVAYRYEELFGEPVMHISDAAMLECLSSEYNPTENTYELGLYFGCGLIDYGSAAIHVINVGNADGGYYVDINIATVYEYEDDFDRAVCEVYRDVYDFGIGIIETEAQPVKYKNCEPGTDGERSTFKLSISDRDNVAKYRFSFDKEYHFTGIKKL